MDELDRSKGYLSQLRALHPIAIGQIISGKRVVETCYKIQGNYCVPLYRLEGEYELHPWQAARYRELV